MDEPTKQEEAGGSRRLSESDLSLLLYRSKIEKARKVLTHLTTAKKNEAFYPHQHPIVIQSLETLYKVLRECAMEEKQVNINIYEDELFYGEQVLTEESLIYSQFIDECLERQIGSMIFLPDLEAAEVATFINLLNQEPDRLTEQGGFSKALQDNKVTHIKISEVKPLATSEGEAQELSEEEVHHLARECYDYAIKTIHEIMDSVGQNQTPNIRKVKNVVRSMVDLISKDRSALLALTAIKDYDQYTYYHSVNVMILSLSLGSNLPLKKVPLSILGIAALLHDIGKTKIPTEIITKPGPLTSEEWKRVERHPIEGAEILSLIPDLNKTAMVVAFEHHIGYDLSGYPKITPKRSIHLYSKIVEIADTYDAMTSRTFYRAPETPDNALSIMLKLSGVIFDPLLLKIFINMLGIYPMGTVVRLESGEIAVVYRTNPNDLLRPKVKLLMDQEGNDLGAEVIDLTDTDDAKQYKHSIERSFDAEAMKIDVKKYL